MRLRWSRAGRSSRGSTPSWPASIPLASSTSCRCSAAPSRTSARPSAATSSRTSSPSAAPTLAASRPYLPSWLATLREFFRGEVVALVQKDAIERKGLTQLLFEPETLPLLEKNVELVATLVSAKGLVPDRAKDIARGIVRE